MKVGLSSSVAFHIAVIGFGLLTFSNPKAFDVSDSESFPVDIVPIEELTQIQQGEKSAPKKEISAPKPSTRPDQVEDAQHVGDQKVDLKTPPRPDEKPKPVETAEAPKSEPVPAQKPEPKPEPEPETKPAEQSPAVPATEMQPKPELKQEVTTDPVTEAIETQAEAIEETALKLPDNVPTPQARPKQTPAQTAKTTDRRAQENPNKPKNSPATEKQEKDAIADEVAALLNREKSSGGGAKRSTEQASLGGRRNTGGSKLSQSEMDALRGQIQRCWNVPAGVADAQGLVVTVKMKLTESGDIEGMPVITSGGAESGVGRVAAESARRAVQRCAPYNLPRDKYDAWSEVIVNFDPSDMF